MKKLLILALASVSFIFYTASLYAADVKFGGEFRVRGFYEDNTTDFHNSDKNLAGAPCAAAVAPSPSGVGGRAGGCNDQQAIADERFRLRGNVAAGMTSGVFALDLTNSFAGTGASPSVFQNPTSAAAPTGDTRLGTVGFGRSYNVVGVREAYLKFKFPTFGATTGRAPFKLGHGLVLDDTADAIAVNFGAMGANLSIADLKLLDANAGGFLGHTGSDSDLYVINATYNHMDEHLLGLFIAYLDDRGAGAGGTSVLGGPFPTAPTQDQIWAVGVSGEGKLAVIKLNAEADILSGTAKKGISATKDAKVSGLNAMINGGMMAGPADVGLLLLYASGQKASTTDKVNVNGFSGNFVLGNILLNNEETADRDGRTPSDILAVKLSAGIKGLPMKECAADVALIWAQLAQKPSTTSNKKDLGTEVDVNLHHKFDENLMLNVGLGALSPGKAWKTILADQNAKNMAYKAGVGVTYSF